MKKLLSLALIACPILATAQVPLGTSSKELNIHQQRIDSLRRLATQQQQKTQAHNDAYLRQHPNYLRQHPEVLKAHPEYRTRYAKYLSGQGKK